MLWTGWCRVTLILIAFAFFYPIVPLYLTHTAGCHVALWLMHPPRAPRSSKWAVAGPRGNLVGCSFLCFPLVVLTYFWGHWQRLWRIVKSCKNIISLFCLWKDSAWYLSCKCVILHKLMHCHTWSRYLISPKKFGCFTNSWIGDEEYTLVIWILGSCTCWQHTVDTAWLRQQGTVVEHL